MTNILDDKIWKNVSSYILTNMAFNQEYLNQLRSG